MEAPLSLEMQMQLAQARMKPILNDMLHSVDNNITIKQLKCLDSLCAFIYGRGSKEYTLFRDTLQYDKLYFRLKMRESRKKNKRVQVNE